MLRFLLTRRRFLSHLSALLAVPTGSVALSGCGQRRPLIEPDMLRALLDTLIPADQDPGAVQAGVPEALQGRLRGDPGVAERYARLLAWLGGRAEERFETPFTQLPLPDRAALIRDVYESTGAPLSALRSDLIVALKHSFEAFYTSPAAQTVIGYHPPIAGGYPDYADPPNTAG